MAPALWLLLLASCLFVLPHVSLAGNCSLVQPRRLTRPGAVYEITGASAVVFPAFNNEPIPGVLANWTLFSLIERNRTLYDVFGNLLGKSECYDPGDADFLFREAVDPFKPGEPNQPCFFGSSKPCGGLYQHLDLTDMDCYQTYQIEPFEGTTRESVVSYLSHPLYPNFSMVASFHLVDAPVTIYPLLNDTSLFYQYDPDALKMTYEVSNFPWQGPTNYALGNYNNASFLGLWFTTEITVPAGRMGVDVRPLKRVVSYNSSDETVRIKIDIDSAYLLDGQPWLQVATPSNLSLVSPTPVTIAIYSTVSLCPTSAAYWNNAIYDPSLSTLFVGDPVAPPGTGKSKNGLTTGQIAVIATVIPVVALLAIFVVVATKVPAVRRLLFKSERTQPIPKK